MEIKPTNGPLGYREDPYEPNKYTICQQNGRWLAVVKFNGELTPAKQRANLGVMLAAPDMLAALQAFIDNDTTPEANCACHISAPCSDCTEYAGHRELVDAARSAIHKTKGVM